MSAPVTVWRVELDAGGSFDEVRGSLSLSDDAVVFTPRDDPDRGRRYPLREVERVRRLLGSPVLILVRATTHGQRRTAFYFVPPPPLEAPEAPERPSLLGVRGGGRRRSRRKNVSYLGYMNREKKPLVREWQRRIGRAAAAARANGA
ncbi:MAG TPA: hypothetical protein VLA90_00165 [Actinomycetota bacterium]|nr:hypothetical protein [Actinomycetota bacterium]